MKQRLTLKLDVAETGKGIERAAREIAARGRLYLPQLNRFHEH
jgi:hypothetical protein